MRRCEEERVATGGGRESGDSALKELEHVLMMRGAGDTGRVRTACAAREVRLVRLYVALSLRRWFVCVFCCGLRASSGSLLGVNSFGSQCLHIFFCGIFIL